MAPETEDLAWLQRVKHKYWLIISLYFPVKNRNLVAELIQMDLANLRSGGANCMITLSEVDGLYLLCNHFHRFLVSALAANGKPFLNVNCIMTLRSVAIVDRRYLSIDGV